MPFHFNYEQKYPYTDFDKINLDWILELATQLKEAAENGDFDGPPGPPGSGTATNGVAYFTTSDTFADIQAAITDGQLPVLMYYNMGTPCFLYCYDHASSVLKFGGLSNTQQLQLTWYSNDTRSFITRTLIDKQAPEFYGFPTIVNTLPAGDSSHKLATTQFVQNTVTAAVQAAIEQLVIAPFSESFKQALLQLARNVAYIDGNGPTYYQALYDALYPPINVESISAVWNPPVGYMVYTMTPIDSLKTNLTVTATYDDQSTAVLDPTDYVLSGTLTAGTSTITVAYANATTTFDVTVVQNELDYITASFNQGAAVIYNNDSLADLVPYLTVTATYTNLNTVYVDYPDYTLSGTLTPGTSTITVSYGGKTDTFTVTVTEIWTWVYDPAVDGLLSAQPYIYVGTTGTKTEEISDDLLHIVVPQSRSANNGYQVRLGDGNGNYNIQTGEIEMKFKFTGICVSASSSTNGIRLQLSQGGTKSAKLFAHKTNGEYKLKRVTGNNSSQTNIATLTADTWYKLNIRLNSSDFAVYLNDVQIYSGNSFATHLSTYSGLYMVAPANSSGEDTDVYIEYIKFYKES